MNNLTHGQRVLIEQVRLLNPEAAQLMETAEIEWWEEPYPYGLHDAFEWSKTPQGHEYWSGLHRTLAAGSCYSRPVTLPEDECRNAPDVPFAQRVAAELQQARSKHTTNINSLHEGYAVILEEVDELWEIVRMKRENRDRAAVIEELVQIAAMAQRTAEDLNLLHEEREGIKDETQV